MLVLAQEFRVQSLACGMGRHAVREYSSFLTSGQTSRSKGLGDGSIQPVSSVPIFILPMGGHHPHLGQVFSGNTYTDVSEGVPHCCPPCFLIQSGQLSKLAVVAANCDPLPRSPVLTHEHVKTTEERMPYHPALHHPVLPYPAPPCIALPHHALLNPEV